MDRIMNGTGFVRASSLMPGQDPNVLFHFAEPIDGIPPRTYLCHGMKEETMAKNGTLYRITKMQPVYEGGLGKVEKMCMFGTSCLGETSYKNKYFVFSKVAKNDRGPSNVRLTDRFAVYDRIEDIPKQELNSDDEYV